MVNIFCSTRLAPLILKKSSTQNEFRSTEHPLDSWNASLFYLEKRKCILFTNKKTLFCVVRFNILKQNLRNEKEFFLNSVQSQFEFENLFDNEVVASWFKSIVDIEFRATDNDKRVIGSMNNFILTAKGYFNYLGNEGELTSNYIAKDLNHIPMGSKYQKPHVTLSNLRETKS